MSDREFNIFKNFEPIPKVFYSEESEAPIEHCTFCNKYLLEDGVQYLVEKAFKNYKDKDVRDVIFEYAICLECHGKLRETMSKKSLGAIERYFSGRIDLEARRKKFDEAEDYVLDNWLRQCILSGEEVKGLDEFQIIGQFDGRDMVYHHLPYAISGNMIEAITDILSAETKDELDDFMQDIIGPSPEFDELFSPTRTLIV